MKFYPLSIILISNLLITACSVQSDISNAIGRKTEEAQEKVDNVVDPVVDAIEQVDQRLKQIQSGATMIREGVDLIQGDTHN